MEEYRPTKGALRLLRWFCPDHLLEEIEGDLAQRFERDVRILGERKARMRLLWSVIRFFRPGIVLRHKFSIELNYIHMMLSHFKFAPRYLAKSKTFTAINILGLSVGMVAFFLIMQYASFEMSFDQFHENRNELVRIAYRQVENGELKTTSAMNYGGMRSLIKDNFAEVLATTGFSPMPNNLGFLIKYNNKMFLEPGRFLRADSNFFLVFPSLLIRGNKATVLKDPHSLVISEKVARKVFGTEDPIGKQISKDHIVTGIMKDIPENSHLHADFVNRTDKEWDNTDNNWNGSPGLYTYASLKPGTNTDFLEGKANGILAKTHPELKGAAASIQPIGDIHLQSQLQNELEANGNKILVYVLVAVGAITLLIAWINYVNMETARFIRRVREVGVRRIIGSTKANLALQFLIEYLYIEILALVLGWVMIQLILPHFRDLTGVPVSNIQLTVSVVWACALLFFLAGSTVTGIYPLWFLLRLNPALAIKGNVDRSQKSGSARQFLIIAQFTSSLVLIGFLIVIIQQVDFMLFTNKKIDLEKVISIRNPTAYGITGFTQQYHEFQQLEDRLLENPSIKMVTGSSAIPGTEVGFTFVNLLKRQLSDPYSAVQFKMLFVDCNYIPLYNLKLKAGRNFSPTLGEDTEIARRMMRNEELPKDYYQTLMLNERAIRALGFQSAEEALNQIIYLHLWADDFEKYKIIGVVEDYHHEALKKEVNPIIFTQNYNRFQQVYFSIKLAAGAHPQEALNYISKSWQEFFPTKPFDYFFLDEYYDQQFKSERHFERIFGSFAFVAVFLACLGILGISLYEANARLKEISIRKVLGASVINVVALLSRDNIKMVLVSTVLAVPIIYFISHNWLSNYPVRIQLSPFVFVAPLVALLVVVFLTSIGQTTKAAFTNPVDHLKYE